MSNGHDVSQAGSTGGGVVGAGVVVVGGGSVCMVGISK